MKFEPLEKVSWWNMSRRARCNALVIDGMYHLWFRSPKHDKSVEWFWCNNDLDETEETVKYDASCWDQLECSFQSNLPLNFVAEMAEEKKEETPESGQSPDSASFLMTNINQRSMLNLSQTPGPTVASHSDGDAERLFSCCSLEDLEKFLSNENKYVLHFNFNDHDQICKITQESVNIKKQSSFPRDVQRTVNGRNSAWPQ